MLCSLWNIPEGLATLVAGTFAIVAAIIAWCAVQRQIRATQRIEATKVRLDLYNRRFQIFTSILDFYQALVQWKGTPDQRTVQLNFLRAYQESGFLFANPEIQEILNGLYEHSGSVIGLMRNREAFETGGQDILLHQLNEKYPALVAEFDAALTRLKALMADDLNFHTIIKR